MKLIILLIGLIFSSLALAEYTDVAMGITLHEDGLGCPIGVKRVRKVYHTTNLDMLGAGKEVIETKDVFGVKVESKYNSFANGKIRGPYTEGAIKDKTTGNLFFGVSYYRDIIGVQTLRDKDEKIVGANIYLSFCEQPPVFTEQRKLDNFETPFEIFVSGGFSFPSNICAFGTVTAVLTTINLAKYENYPAFKAQNTFAPITPKGAMMVCAGKEHVTTQDGPRRIGEEETKVPQRVAEIPATVTPR